MNLIYEWIGFIVFWLAAVFGMFLFVYYSVTRIYESVAKKLNIVTIMLEYSYYRKNFKEWVKDEERIKSNKK